MPTNCSRSSIRRLARICTELELAPRTVCTPLTVRAHRHQLGEGSLIHTPFQFSLTGDHVLYYQSLFHFGVTGIPLPRIGCELSDFVTKTLSRR